MLINPNLVVPPGWSVERCPETGDDLLLCDALPASGFRPRATLTSARCALSLREWQDAQVLAVRQSLSRVDVEDVDIHDLGMCDAAYVRVLHTFGERDVITEIWSWVAAEVAWTLRATVDHCDYADFCDVFEQLALSFRSS
ncbi:hypothetical protein [Nocardioides alcanivorans]|uniref:hypothetical protein n=1 Tax=Nocardioides alcanivorans TaxID=2897352 RepID=UPI001F3D2335|nr:hypothetical protein [Nocardioides alcanivorans]